ncbi:MAG TPA: hypothetical protein VF834_11540 [Streptosporangiaceae bacterium]
MAMTLRTPRTHGALSGVLLILLGAWGGLIAFVGPYFHYAYTPDRAWTYTSGRLWLEILPGAAALVGGLILLVSTLRPLTMLGALIAIASGAWFAVGGTLIPLWTHSTVPAQGVPAGGTLARAVEQIGFFSGLGVVMVLVAATALGRLAAPAARLASAPVTDPDSAQAPGSEDSRTGSGSNGDSEPSRMAVLRRVAMAKSSSSSGS